MTIKEVEHNQLILCGYAGSITYGTNNPDSDIDIRGVFIPPKSYWLGLDSVEQVTDQLNDTVYYELRKFFNLALNANPNILEILWLRDNHYLWNKVPKHLQKFGQKLIANRRMFLSKKVRHSYMGYAYAQFHRMDKLNKNVGMNKKRVDSVNKFGYDVKNAMHLIRLCKMGLEVLTEGELFVFREDAQFLRQIREGKYSYQELSDMFHKYENLVEEVYVRSELPSKPDVHKAKELLTEMVEEYLFARED
jgi:predicted nucleotidyltransferase